MKIVVNFTIMILSVWSATVEAYDPPIGIPNPADTFGALDPIDTPKPDTTTHCPGWHASPTRANTRAAGDARDAWYVDNTHPNATDSSNPYGHPDKPRLNYPSQVFSPGDYVEIHGDGNPAALASPYTVSNFNPRGVGTDTNPIWFVGVDQPVFTGSLNMGFSDTPRIAYMVFDGLQWRDGARVDIRPRKVGNSIDHIVFRNCLLRGRASATDSTGFNVGSSTADPQYSELTTENVVFYNGEVSHYGSFSDPGEEMCFYVSGYVTNFWLLESDIHHAAEDGMQFGHAMERTSSRLFVGRNQIHENLTDPIDIKATGDHVVFSENNIWGHYDVWVNGVHKSTGSGAGSAFHYAGSSSGSGFYNNYPEDISFLFNTVRDSRSQVGTSSCGRLRVVGNTFYRSRREPSDYTDVPYALDLRGFRGETWIAHNTIYDCEGGIRVWDTDPPAYNSGAPYYGGSVATYNGKTYVVIFADNYATGIQGIPPTNTTYWDEVRVQIVGNLISSTYNGEPSVRLNDATFSANSIDMDYNLVYDSSGKSMVIGSGPKVSLNSIQLTSPHMDNGLAADPKLTNPGSSNFTLLASSPAINAAVEGIGLSAYQDYFNRFGIDIRRDITGAVRPIDGAWDMGAHEFGVSTPVPIPPPSGLRLDD